MLLTINLPILVRKVFSEIFLPALFRSTRLREFLASCRLLPLSCSSWICSILARCCVATRCLKMYHNYLQYQKYHITFRHTLTHCTNRAEKRTYSPIIGLFVFRAFFSLNWLCISEEKYTWSKKIIMMYLPSPDIYNVIDSTRESDRLTILSYLITSRHICIEVVFPIEWGLLVDMTPQSKCCLHSSLNTILIQNLDNRAKSYIIYCNNKQIL